MPSRLWEALDLVRNGTMCKHVLTAPDGSHCARGFLQVVHTQGHSDVMGLDVIHLDETSYCQDDYLLGEVLSELFPDRMMEGFEPYEHTAIINNHPDTTKENLEMAFEKAAIRADELLT